MSKDIVYNDPSPTVNSNVETVEVVSLADRQEKPVEVPKKRAAKKR